MTFSQSLILVLTLAACSGDGDLPAYYSGGPAPEPSALSQHREDGNVGGDVVSIVGDNFGGDHNAITVVFGSQNAELISVDDDELVVRVPQGPIQGGRVDVLVATASGQGSVPGGYVYDVGSVLDQQVGYILLNDQWHSCYGGIGMGSTGGCNEISYNGYTGLEGQAAFLNDVKFPNLHSMYMGWSGGSDMSWGQWKIQTPGQMANSFDMESALDDMMFEDIYGFTIRNSAWESTSLREDEDQYWCTQLNQLDRFRYSGGVVGGEYMPPFEVSGEGSVVASEMGTSFLDDMTGYDEDCKREEGQREYDRSKLSFCETDDADVPRTFMYKAEWPVGRNFMGRKRTNDQDETAYFDETRSSDISVSVPEVGLNAEMRFPPTLKVYGTTGFETGGDASLWSLVGLETCGDSDGDGLFGLSDTTAKFEWRPFTGELSTSEDSAMIRESRSYVRVTLHVMDLGWFGGIGSSVRASIAVPDDNGFDPETGFSSVEVPAWVFYQLPTVNSQWGQSTSLGGSPQLSWGDPLKTGYGYLIVQVDRVTEYAVRSSELGGDVIVVHASGDFGFMGWDNPILDPDDCGDCSDNDGDGWADGDDPDCRGGRNEDNSSYGQSTCNDGIDNDSDGQIDSRDTDCTTGSDPESPECGDGVDNDGDGWADNDDPDCSEGAGLFEDNSQFGNYDCNDGEDNDADGWVDSEDPACGSASDPEDDGFAAETECNDGVDNDGNGDVDAEDMLCASKGPSQLTEQGEPSGDCVDGLDNDGDGFIDAKDPDCELLTFRRENEPSRDPDVYVGIDQCYDGMDNDLDGVADADDPGCWDADGEPNGFIDDESLATFDGGGDADTDDTGGAIEDTGDDSSETDGS